MKKIFGYFLQGLLYLGPIALTIYIIIQAFNFIDGLLKEYIEHLAGFQIPGLGLIIIFIFLTVLGYFGQTILAAPFKLLFNKILLKIPPLKLIYSSLSDLFSAIVGKERKFNSPVLVKINENPVIERIGFITEEQLDRFDLVDKVAVYFPFSYAINGELHIVSRENISPLHISGSDALKFIVSGGVAEINPDVSPASSVK